MATDQDAALAGPARIEPGVIAALKDSLTAFEAAAGEMLFRQNDPADGMHVIVQGRIRVQGRTLADGLVQLAEVGPGDIVGEFSLIDLGRRSAGAEAMEATKGYFLPREQFERLAFMGNPAIVALARHIRRLACARTRATLAAIAETPAADGELQPAPRASAAPEPWPAEGGAAMLAALHQFAGFKPDEIERLVAATCGLGAARGAGLAAQAGPPDGFYLILRGALRTGLTRASGVEQLLIHGPGKIVGGVAALDGGPQPARIDVREDAILLHLPQDRVAELETDTDPAGVKLVDLLGKQLTADLRSLSRRQGRQRSMAALNGLPAADMEGADV